MKNGWQTKKLGDLVEVQNGYAFSSKDYSQSGHFLMRIGNVQNGHISTADPKFIKLPSDGSLKRFVLYEGDILVSLTGNVGRVGVMREEHLPAALNQRVARISIRKDSPATRELILLFLCSDWFREELSDAGHGAAQQNVSTKDLVEIEIPIPPLDEQKRIVAKLDEAFVGLAKAKENAEKNLQNARALFESHLDSVFTQRGPGWKMEKLDVLTELARGHNPPKSKFIREQKPGYVRFYQIRDGGSDDYACYVPDTPQLHKMKKDDIMMVAYRHVGRAFRGVEGAFNVALCKISNARRDILDDDYLFHLIPSQYVKGELLKRSERSLIPSMSIEHLRELRIPLPPLREQQHIVKLINSLSKETQRLARLYERKLEALESLKKSILHEAFSGEL